MEAENQDKYRECKGYDAYRERSLNSSVTNHRTESAKSIRTTALLAVQFARRVVALFFRRRLPFFPASFAASIVFILYESISRRRPRILRASTCKNFISSAYIQPLYLRSFITFFRGSYAPFFRPTITQLCSHWWSNVIYRNVVCDLSI